MGDIQLKIWIQYFQRGNIRDIEGKVIPIEIKIQISYLLIIGVKMSIEAYIIVPVLTSKIEGQEIRNWLIL